uniref:hypothetical protein n=1 Tax=Acetatifactor sp. TaxID=1872090 RepID=UPI004055FB49
MEFEKKGPEGGLEMYAVMENGKAILEYKTYLQKGTAEEMLEEIVGEKDVSCKEVELEFRMWDRNERLVFRAKHPLFSEKLPKGLLLHPHLWQGTEDPYLYRVKVTLLEKGHVVDAIEDTFAFRTFREIPGKGWFLNGERFQVKAMAYVIPATLFLAGILDRSARSARIRKDLEKLRRMGANTICPVGGDVDREFCRICDEVGMLVWMQSRSIWEKQNSMPVFHGRFPIDRYYYYKAYWSKEPFVYICLSSLKRQANGTVKLTVYSNQKKVVLYVDGVLFEFRSDGPEFVFEEIPVKQIPLMLTAEAEDCSMSVTVSTFI